jgi:hypothetical protein
MPEKTKVSNNIQIIAVILKNWRNSMNEKVTNVFHGFMNLANLEKLKLVEAINEYFDSNER